MKKIITLLLLLCSLQVFATSTEEILYYEYADYYESAPYEINFCHKNHAKFLRFLKQSGSDLQEMNVLIIQQDKSKPRLTPQNGKYDNGYAWHVVVLYDGLIYDLNANFSPEGIPLEDYFGFVLGYDTKLSNVLLRAFDAKFFYSYFYNDDGSEKSYNPDDFIKKFLSINALTPLSSASMLKWY